MKRILVLLVGLHAFVAAVAAPPTLTIPPDLKPVNGYIRFTPDTTAKSVLYVAQDDAYPFPSEELKDARRFVLPVQGLKDGVYRFVAVGSLNDEQTATPFAITIGKKPPVVVDPPPGGDPKPVPGESYQIMVVRNELTTEIKQVMRLGAWAEVRAAGHVGADWPYNDLPARAKQYMAEQKATAPCVLYWRRSADGLSLTLDEKIKPVAMPKADPEVRALLEVLK